MASIYELTGDWLQVWDYLEYEDIDLETLENTLQCIEAEIEDKADNYAKLIKNLDAEVRGLKDEETRLAARRKSKEKSIERLKNNLYWSMKAVQKDKIKTPTFSFNIQKNPPSLVVDESAVPEEYLIPQPPKVDNAKIKELLKTTELDFAHLEQGESLRIR